VRRRQIVRVGLGAGVVAAVGAATAAGFGFGGSASPPADEVGRPPALVPVTRATLTRTERVGGTLGYGPPSTAVARSGLAGGPTGTITWLPAIGSTVRPGQPLYTVDSRPVVLLQGTVPPYRILAIGLSGADVAQLELNLAVFGYRGFTADSRFTEATAGAVRRWQRSLGIPRTGRVDVDEIVVAPGPVRITEHRTVGGAPAAGPVLTYTSTVRVVTVALEVTRQHLVHVGLSAEVVLPDGRPVAGTVAAVGTVAARPSPTAPSDVATVEVVVTIANEAALGTLDGAPVDLTLAVDRRDGVLTVPVSALIALADGGYGVQVVDGSATRYLPVRTGMFANGRVEVSGPGVVEGVLVGVPR
jgi:peptidoglycan hydrolase-like protein with peptidoglycan-binding domain